MTVAVRGLVRTGGAIAAVASALLCATCNYGEVTVVQPAAKGSGALTLTIQPDGEDAAVATELGWGAGIPGADVTIAPGAGDTAVGPPIATLVTDSAGKVSVLDLPDGKYFVQVHRLLRDAEMTRLAPGNDAIGFMTQTVVGRGNVTLSVPASHRRSIVISEWSFFGEGIPGVGGYMFGGYLELTNNSDSTIYLDGLVIGEAFSQLFELQSPFTCAESESLGDDPDGIWARYLDSLPGAGHSYPLAPGAVAMVATDAIDHTSITPEGLDLRRAAFDFVGTADATNPAVPNTVTIGQELYPDGHGLYLNRTTTEVAFIALPVDTSVLPRQRLPVFGTVYERVPRARILDAISIFWPGSAPAPLCPHLVHGNFDRRQAPLLVSHVGSEGDAGRYSIQRRIASTRADGRKILQHTRTTDADFFLGLRTPFQLPN